MSGHRVSRSLERITLGPDDDDDDDDEVCFHVAFYSSFFIPFRLARAAAHWCE